MPSNGEPHEKIETETKHEEPSNQITTLGNLSSKTLQDRLLQKTLLINALNEGE